MSASVSVSLRWPPSGRDFGVYQRVVIDAASTRQAAGEFRLSQTRVRQVLKRVNEWLAETLPADGEASDADCLRLAQHVAAVRLEYFYGEAMRGWREWKQPKYAGLALRVIAAQSKLPVMPGTIDALFADAIEGPLPEEEEVPEAAQRGAGSAQRRVPSAGPQSAVAAASEIARREPRDERTLSPAPPVRDCSGPAPTGPAAADEPAAEPIVTPAAARACEQLPPDLRAARSAFFAPAQPPVSDDDDAPVTELKITPQTLGLSVEEVLSRSQRRKRRRLERRARAGA